MAVKHTGKLISQEFSVRELTSVVQELHLGLIQTNIAPKSNERSSSQISVMGLEYVPQNGTGARVPQTQLT